MVLLIYAASFIVLLGVLVVIHEYGHYVIARMSGVQVLRFSVGFGKPLISRVDKHGTEFVVAAIPFGGFVRMLDDRDPDQAELKHPDSVSYMDLHPAWRIAISLGGPVANFILAFVVFAILQFAGSPEFLPITAAPEEGSTAYEAGLSSQVEIEQVDGVATATWQDVGLALTRRLGETGDIVIEARDVKTAQLETYYLPITNWHQGVGDPDVIRTLGLQPTLLARIGVVVEGTPAYAAGLQAGDLLVDVDGVAISNWREMSEAR